MKSRIRFTLFLCIISTLMLTGFTCSKQVPTNESKPVEEVTPTADEAPQPAAPQDQMTTETPVESTPPPSTQ